jgi:hypothetical protein
VPGDLQAGGKFYPLLLDDLRRAVSAWPKPARFDLRSIFVMVSAEGTTHEVQAAVNGFLDDGLTAALSELPWPATNEAYFYKQLFVLRGGKDD